MIATIFTITIIALLIALLVFWRIEDHRFRKRLDQHCTTAMVTTPLHPHDQHRDAPLVTKLESTFDCEFTPTAPDGEASDDRAIESLDAPSRKLERALLDYARAIGSPLLKHRNPKYVLSERNGDCVVEATIIGPDCITYRFAATEPTFPLAFEHVLRELEAATLEILD